MYNITPYSRKPSGNNGKLVVQKLSLKLEEVSSIRTRLDLANNLRELTMFSFVCFDLKPTYLNNYTTLTASCESTFPP